MAAGDEKTDITALLLSNRSAAAFALGKYAAAVSDASRSAELRPQWAKGHFRRAEALLALGRMRDAHAGYKRALMLEPRDVHVRVSCERSRIMAQNEEMGLSVVQLLAGRDFALKPRGLHPIRAKIFEFAVGMQNYVYLIADADTRKCVVVDACWDVDGILAVVEREKLLLAAAAVTHGHFDHTGGVPPPPFSSLRIKVSGVGELKRRFPHLPLLVHPLDIPEVTRSNPQLKPHHFTPTPNGFGFRLGSRTQLSFVHTPGHTPGSQCVVVNGCRLFSGDTLFPGSCGRVDLEGGCLEDMLESLQTRLASISDQTIVYPGHEYGGEWTSIGREKKRGFLRPVAEAATGVLSAEDRWRWLDQQAK
ncbi:beta-lactamase-like protein [Coemansia spiralis]|nr:beta-lactamase-like protein [Coemansia spiralis]